MGCEKANTTRGYWGISLKYWILWASLEHGWFPLSRYGNGGIDSLTPVPRRTTGIGHPTCSLGGLKRATACEHMKYRVLRACLAVVKLLVFNCAFLKYHRSCQPCCPTCIASQLYFCSYKQFKTTEWSRASLWTSYQRGSVHLPARQTVLHFKVVLTELQNLFKDWSITYAHPWRLCGCLKISKRN